MKIYIMFLLVLSSSFFIKGQNIWQKSNAPYGGDVQALAINSKGELFAGVMGYPVFCSTNSGNTWIKTGANNAAARSLAADSNDYLYEGTLS